MSIDFLIQYGTAEEAQSGIGSRGARLLCPGGLSRVHDRTSRSCLANPRAITVNTMESSRFLPAFVLLVFLVVLSGCTESPFGPIEAAFRIDCPQCIDENIGIAPVRVTFDASPSRGFIISYTWDFGDGTSATGMVVSKHFTQPGTYKVVLIVKGASGQMAQASTQFTVKQLEKSEKERQLLIGTLSSALLEYQKAIQLEKIGTLDLSLSSMLGELSAEIYLVGENIWIYGETCQRVTILSDLLSPVSRFWLAGISPGPARLEINIVVFDQPPFEGWHTYPGVACGGMISVREPREVLTATLEFLIYR